MVGLSDLKGDFSALGQTQEPVQKGIDKKTQAVTSLSNNWSQTIQKDQETGPRSSKSAMEAAAS